MRTLLFLNGPLGSQSGIEDGFNYLYNEGFISELKWFYFDEYAQQNSFSQCISEMLVITNEFLPNLIIVFHIGKFPISKNTLIAFKNLRSNPILVYDEGDMYGGWSKPITPSMKKIFRLADIVSIRGLGKWHKIVSRYNKNIIYTPHSNSLARLTKDILPKITKTEKIIFIGNKVKSRLGIIRRLPGARGRERLVKDICTSFPNEFKLYGVGWNTNSNYMGKLEFNMQAEICSNALIHLSFEHYPKVSYYYSDRLPISLASGQIYVCHYHEGYENIFKNCDFIYFFKSTKEAIDIINYILSLDPSQLYQKTLCAKIFADQLLSPETVWSNFFKSIIEKKNII